MPTADEPVTSRHVKHDRVVLEGALSVLWATGIYESTMLFLDGEELDTQIAERLRFDEPGELDGSVPRVRITVERLA